MGKRGGDGNSKAKGGGANAAGGAQQTIVDRRNLDDSAAPGVKPSDAAEQLGLPADAKPAFVDGANDVDALINPGGGKAPRDPADALADWRLRVSIYERKHGRAKARAYSRGGYWAVVKAVKTALALGAVVGVTVPGQGAVNAGMIGGYWATTR